MCAEIQIQQADAPKTNCADARKYMTYILECIRTKGKHPLVFQFHTFLPNAELFSSLDLSAHVYWELLVWMDRANYCGTKEQDELAAGRKRRGGKGGH